MSSSRASMHMALGTEAASPAVQKALRDYPFLSVVLPPTSPARRPVALCNSTITEDPNDTSLPLDDRPWEIFEQLLPPSRALPRSEQFLNSKPLKDTASIPMALFDPKVKRDAIPHALEEDDASKEESARSSDTDLDAPWETYASERNLGDGHAGEPTPVKQISTKLFAGPEEDTVEDDITIIGHNRPSSQSRATIAAQPGRSSNRIAAGKTIKGAITVENPSNDDDSDEPEPIGMPAGKRPRGCAEEPGWKVNEDECWW